jgi:hypothetical protein
MKLDLRISTVLEFLKKIYAGFANKKSNFTCYNYTQISGDKQTIFWVTPGNTN